MHKQVKKSAKAHEKTAKSSAKGDKAALKGLKSAAPSHSPAPGKQKSPVDPTKGLREAIKAKQIEALAMQAASAV
jgi:hypothetical protein